MQTYLFSLLHQLLEVVRQEQVGRRVASAGRSCGHRRTARAGQDESLSLGELLSDARDEKSLSSQRFASAPAHRTGCGRRPNLSDALEQ